MSHFVICPGCGKRVRTGADDPPDKRLCVACGRMFEAEPIPVPDEAMGSVGTSTGFPAGPAAPPASATGAGLPRPGAAWVVAASLLILLIGVATFAFIQRSRNRDVAVQPSTPMTPPAARVGRDGPATIRPGQHYNASAPTVAPAAATARANSIATAPAPVTNPAVVPASSPATATSPATGPGPVALREPPPRRADGGRASIIETPIPNLGTVTDERVTSAIRRGIENLASQFDGGKRVAGRDAGDNALVVYALLECAQAVHDDRLDLRGDLATKLLDVVVSSKIGIERETFSRAIRVMLLARFGRAKDGATLEADAKRLIAGQFEGTYGPALGAGRATELEMTDNGDGFFGLLGVAAAADAGVPVPAGYWEAARRHWERSQRPDGGWATHIGNPTDRLADAVNSKLATTAAGVAALLIVQDHTRPDEEKPGDTVPPLSPSVTKGLAWLAADRSRASQPVPEIGARLGYSLFAADAARRASGLKMLRDVDWFRTMVDALVVTQTKDGAWGLPDDTAFAMLALVGGRQPILANKLQFAGTWSNHPRDLSCLSSWVSKQIGRPVEWQVVPVEAPFERWTESPILYVASEKAPPFTSEDLGKLRRFAEAGGMIFTHADGSSPAFNAWVERVAPDIFPGRKLIDLPAGHPIYSAVKPVEARDVPLRAVTNGVRVLLLHSPHDLASEWQRRDTVGAPAAFRIAENLHAYAAGGRDAPGLLQRPYLPEPKELRQRFRNDIAVARVQYEGEWDPEPGAWVRFTRSLGYSAGYRASVRPVRWQNLSAGSTPFAHLTGVAAYTPTDAEVAALRTFVESGGVLLIDDCGGGGAFTGSLRDTLARAFGVAPQALPPQHPLLNSGEPGMSRLTPASLRPSAEDVQPAPMIEAIYAGRGTLLLSSVDIVSGLLGTNAGGIRGYAPQWSEAFLRNALFWTLDGQATGTGPLPDGVVSVPAGPEAPSASAAVEKPAAVSIPPASTQSSPATSPVKATQPVAVDIAPPGTIATTKPGLQRPPPTPALRRIAARHRPALQKFPVPLDYGVSDEMIEDAIRRGIDLLGTRLTPDGKHATGDPGYAILGIYALAQASLAVDDPRLNPRGPLLTKLLDATAAIDLSEYSAEVYARGTRATCLALFNRPKDRKTLEEDVNALRVGHSSGAYSYRASPAAVAHWGDLSNSQFGLLGVWSGADAGVEVPAGYWRTVEKFWEAEQQADGGWSYLPKGREQLPGGLGKVDQRFGEPTFSMTAAGVASLFVARDRLAMEDRTDRLGQPSLTPALERGLHWMDTQIKSGYEGYVAFSVERVGLASGFKHFGGVDWYRYGAAKIVKNPPADAALKQNDGPAWRPGMLASRGLTAGAAFDLLFLAKGRYPILFNKLRFDGFWSNRPRDLAGLTPWVSRQLERPLNWQVVSIDAPWHEWMDSPVLYIASHKAPNLTTEQVDKLRAFADAGGLIFTHDDGSMPEFDEFVTRLAHQLYPQYEYVPVPPSHPLYSLVHKIDWQKMPLRAISNGSRLLMVHSRADLSKHWQWRDAEENPQAFQIAANLHVYAAGKSELRNRLDTAYLPDPAGADRAKPTLRVARVEYPGNWDPEPEAWQRFRRLLRFRTGYWVGPEAVQWKALDAKRTPLAHLTGTARYVPTEAEVAAMRAYVEAGGVLLIDDCGGSGAFTNGLREALAVAFGNDPKPLPPGHPLLLKGPPGMADVTDRIYRRFTIESMRGRKPPPLEVIYAGKGTVLLSRLDIASGLLGSSTWGILGYASKWSESFMQNLVLWTLDGQPTE